MSTRKKKSGGRRQSRPLVPKRAGILRYLAERDEPLNETVLYRAFGLRDPRHWRELSDRLERMQIDGQVLKDRRERWALPKRMDMVRGRVTGHTEGYGFLTPDQGGGDLYVPANEMRKVLLIFHRQTQLPERYKAPTNTIFYF